MNYNAINVMLFSSLPRCMQDKIFGPVVCLTLFQSKSEVVARANNTEYGL